ncbi:MAG: CpXC domain-containing protein [Anaerolineae bacterium]|nr:CpXC domain-containing protein [Anaerolineae bacterium]
MPPRYAAAIGCPACGTRFQTPVEQILDIRVDPGAKSRMLSGTVNLAVCPNCGTAAMMNVPFIYHDPENETALLYLPVDAGPNEVERQKAAGKLAQELMRSMPPEERKGYLLQPETFISMETMVKRVLELEGITEEDMERSQDQRELLNTFLTGEKEAWDQVVADNIDLIDDGFFSLLQYVGQMVAQTNSAESDMETFDALQEYLLQNTDFGKELAQRSEAIQVYVSNPSRETLLQALIATSDEETRSNLIQAGMEMLDYAFFQQLLQQIEQAATDAEKQALTNLRKFILSQRDEIAQATQALAQERAILLGKLIETENPQLMANSHLSELDDAFYYVLNTQMQDAQRQKSEKRIKDLQRVAQAVNAALESTLPPEVAFTRRLMAISDETQLRKVLGNNKQALTPQYLAFLQAVENSAKEQSDVESTTRISRILTIIKEIAPDVNIPDEPVAEQPQAKPGVFGTEERTPSGLIIAKR